MNSSTMKLLAERCYKCPKLQGVSDNKKYLEKIASGAY